VAKGEGGKRVYPDSSDAPEEEGRKEKGRKSGESPDLNCHIGGRNGGATYDWEREKGEEGRRCSDVALSRARKEGKREEGEGEGWSNYTAVEL